MQRAFAPFDAVFDLLQESGAAMRSQAEAVEDAAHSLERVAGLMKVQADLFERTVRTMREPAEVVKSLREASRRRSRTAKGRAGAAADRGEQRSAVRWLLSAAT